MSSDPVVPETETDETRIIRAPLDETVQIIFGDEQDNSETMDGRAGEFYSWNPTAVLEGSSGSDTIDGGDGFDELFYIDETSGFSSTGIRANLTDTTVNGLTAGEVDKGAGGTDSVQNFEGIHGSQHNDTIHINSPGIVLGTLTIKGFVADRAGDDSVVGGDQNTRFFSGSGNDTYIGGGSDDELFFDISLLDLNDGNTQIFDAGGAGTQGIDLELDGEGVGTVEDPWGNFDVFVGIEKFFGTSLDDTMEGNDGDDFFDGAAGDDTLWGEEGSDTLYGGDGNDWIDPGNSNDFDIIFPGAGFDTIDLSNITVSLASVTISHLDLPGGVAASIEGQTGAAVISKPDGNSTIVANVQKAMNAGGLTLVGTFFDDQFDVAIVDDGRATLQGSAGNDIFEIHDHSGLVRLDYRAFGVSQGIVADLSTGSVSNDGFGNSDSLIGDGEITEIRGTDFADHITGSDAGRESYILEGGDDTLIAGANFDQLRYDRAGVGDLDVDLISGTATGTWHGEAFTHSFSGIEAVRGGDGDDDLNASGANFTVEIATGAGNDTVTGGIWADFIFAVQGDNTVNGGAASDYIVTGENNNFIDGGEGTTLTTDVVPVTDSEADAPIELDGTDFDTVELIDEDSGLVIVDFTATGGVSLTGMTSSDQAGTQRYKTETVNIERVALNVDGEAQVIGGATNDVVSLTRLPELLIFHGGDGTDELQFHQNFLLPGDSSLGLKSDEFLSLVDVSQNDIGHFELSLKSDNSHFATFSGVEAVNFTNGTKSLSDLLGDLPTTINGTEGDDSITGTADDEVILALGGDDTIRNLGGGQDTYNGGDGVDTLITDVTGLTDFEVVLFDADLGQHGSRDDDDDRDAVIGVENFIFVGAWDVEAIGDDAANELTTDTGDDTLQGGAGNDLLAGGSGDDSVVGGAGNDTIVAGTGTDTFEGGTGIDTILRDTTGSDPNAYIADINLALGETGAKDIPVFRDSLIGFENIDFRGPVSAELIGDDGANGIESGSGNDTLVGAAGNDTLDGGAGDDILAGGAGDDILIGSSGADRAVIDAALKSGGQLAVTLSEIGGSIVVSSAQGNDTVADDVEEITFSDETVTFEELEQLASGGIPTIEGTGAGETLNGTAEAEVINAFGGADWIEPGGGNDTIDGGGGRDMLSLSLFGDSPGRVGGQFRVYLDMEEGVSENYDGSERIEFTSIERLTSTIYTDLVRGTPGDDQIRTLGDYDWIVATAGNDTYDGGTGNDMISFLEFGGTGAATPGFFEGGTLPPADEDLAGVRVDLTDPSNNTGLAANKTLISIERVTGSSFQDVFVGDDSSNNLRGMGGYDWFVASDGGRERYFGGNGIDTVTYHIAPDAITASLINGTPNDDGETGFGSKGWARKDLYFSIENLVGSAFDDSLEGSSAKNQLSGMDGDDIIFGLGGGDQLKGGLGDDTLNGGAGSDRAMYDFDRDEYTLTRTAAKTVTISHATEGTDSLQDVEYFEFADVTVDVWSLTIV